MELLTSNTRQFASGKESHWRFDQTFKMYWSNPQTKPPIPKLQQITEKNKFLH